MSRAEKLHKCFFKGCGTQIPGSATMCDSHWKAVPATSAAEVARALKALHRPGGKDRYFQAIHRARDAAEIELRRRANEQVAR